MSESQRRIHPLTATAAIALIILSAVGVAVMTGIIPTSSSREAAAPAPLAATEAPAAAPSPTVPAEPPQLVAKPAPQATGEAAPAKRAAPPRQPVRKAPPAEQQFAQAPAAPPAPKPAAMCHDCGIVDSIQVSEQQGEGTGLGAVAGGVAGGLIGSQFGKGTGKTVATVAGAAAGAYGGHQVEKHVKTSQRWNVRVFMEDGSTRTITQDTEPGFKPGDRVKVVDGKLVAG